MERGSLRGRERWQKDHSGRVGWRGKGRLMHGTDTEGERRGEGVTGRLPLTVSLEDLRLLKLEARVEVRALNVAFFLGSGSALALFLS